MSDGQRGTLQALSRSQTAPHRQVQRATALLLAVRWCGECEDRRAGRGEAGDGSGVAGPVRRGGLGEAREVRAGRGRKSTIPQEKIDEIVHLTRHSTPEGQTHWSCRTMAATAGVSPATVQRVWAARGLKPHLVETFKLSNDPKFEEKLIDVVGLYLNPPEKAIVLCMDEKSSVQALDRTQPSLPMKQGRAQTMTHDYKRNGTATLFAALDVLTGTVIGQCLPRHRHTEFLKFLRTIDREVPEALAVHLICDNYATHKHASVRAWLDKHPRFHLHFTPTSSSWLNLVERWFRELTDKVLRRGVFHSVPDLIAKIEDYLAAHNNDPKPFVLDRHRQDIPRPRSPADASRSKRSTNDETHH